MAKIARHKKNYGIPYMGSKSAIAEWVVSSLPAADNFYDLFAGGCAVTHAALLLRNFKRYIINDINPMPTQLFLDAIHGGANDDRWISREDYNRLKDSDAIVAYLWSFSNNPNLCYMYGEEIEPLKRAVHYAIFYNDYVPLLELGINATHLCRYENRSAKYLAWKHFVKFHLKKRIDLQSLESLERLQSLERLERLERLNNDYREIDILPNSVLYCDIPYEDTAGYKGAKFNHADFFEWAQEQREPVIISSYQMPKEFVPFAKTHKIELTSNNRGARNECLFAPIKQVKKGIIKL